jgi:serine/threonine protein phosphatase PrpC
MEIDPYKYRNKIDDSTLLYAIKVDNRNPDQNIISENFSDECFVMAVPVKQKPNGTLASILSCQTAVWGYKLIRQRKFYWSDKRLLIKRIFRSVNIAVWQKQRESGFETGIAASLAVSIIGPENIWIGTVGDNCALIFRDGKLIWESAPDIDGNGVLTKSVGTVRFGLIPSLYSQQFIANDTLILLSQSVRKNIDNIELEKQIGGLENSQDIIDSTVDNILNQVARPVVTDNLGVCIVRRIR